jgi:hypothetical protein
MLCRPCPSQGAGRASFDRTSPIDSGIRHGWGRVIGRTISVVPPMFQLIGMFSCGGCGKPKISIVAISCGLANGIRYIMRARADKIRRRSISGENERPSRLFPKKEMEISQAEWSRHLSPFGLRSGTVHYVATGSSRTMTILDNVANNLNALGIERSAETYSTARRARKRTSDRRKRLMSDSERSIRCQLNSATRSSGDCTSMP